MTDLRQAVNSTETPSWRKAANLIVEIVVNILLPLLVFNLARGRLGDAHALMSASAPPLIWAVIEFARRRRVDALSLMVLTGMALSFIAFFGGGGVRFLQLRETLVGGVIGLIFLGSAAIGRPLVYYTARATMRRTAPVKAAQFVALRNTPLFRRASLVMTLAWGVGLLAECVAAVGLTFVLSVNQFLIAGPVASWGTIGLLTAWTIWYARRTIGAPLQAATDAAEAEKGV